MTKNQRITLIGGAILLVLIMIGTPNVVIYQGAHYDASMFAGKALASIPDIYSGILRFITVVGATVLVFLSLSKKDKRGNT